jgi:hypothetical protein
MKFRTILLGLSALFVASNAAYFSVNGLAMLFAGASLSVMIMASSLEAAKLIGASFLYNYWSTMGKFVRSYLVGATFLLVILTSIGIYGYLTAAYQTTSDQLTITDKQTEMILLKKGRYETQLTDYNVEKAQLTETINELSKGLANNVIQYKDKESGEIITTTSVSTRRVLTSELNDSKEQRTLLNDKIEVMNDSITSFDIQVLNLKIDDTVAAEVGPLRFLAGVTGLEMGTVVNILTLIIIFVFDPLAVILIVAFNTALKVDRGIKDKKKVIKHRELYNDDGITESDMNRAAEEAMKEMMDGAPTFIPPGTTVQEPPKRVYPNPNEIEVIDEEIIKPPLDTNGDKLVTQEEFDNYYENGGWKDLYKGTAYFHNPKFNWNKTERWINNEAASNHWLEFLGGNHTALETYRNKN